MVEEEIPAERKNPLTGAWEILTFRQWRLLQCGIPISEQHKVDDWMFAVLRGPVASCCFAFGLDFCINQHTIEWLAEQLELFKVRGVSQLYAWSQFMRTYYNIGDDELEQRLKKVAIDKQNTAKATALVLQFALEMKQSDKGGTQKRRRKSK